MLATSKNIKPVTKADQLLQKLLEKEVWYVDTQPRTDKEIQEDHLMYDK